MDQDGGHVNEDDSPVVVSRAMLKSFGQWFRIVVTVMMTIVMLLSPELS